MIRYARKFIAMRAAQRMTLLAAAVLVPWFWLALRVVGLQRLAKRLQVVAKARAVPAFDAEGHIRQVVDLVDMAANHSFLAPNCLTRSLALQWLLGRGGIATQLRIGVRLERGQLEAHAWVEFQGTPINDQPDIESRYRAFPGPVAAHAFSSP